MISLAELLPPEQRGVYADLVPLSPRAEHDEAAPTERDEAA